MGAPCTNSYKRIQEGTSATAIQPLGLLEIDLEKMLNRKLPPFASQVQDFNLLKPRNIQLTNGVPVYVFSAGNRPIINLQVIFKAGKWYETHKSASVLLAKMLTEGTRNYTAPVLSAKFDELGAFLEVNAGTDLLYLEVVVLEQHTEIVCELLAEMMEYPTFPEEEFHSLKNRIATQYMVNLERNAYLGNVLLKKQLFGQEHPYGYFPSPENIKNFPLEAIRENFRQTMYQQPFDILIAGQVEDRHLAILEKHFGNIGLSTSNRVPASPYARDFSVKPGKHFEAKPNSLQTSIKIGKKIPHKAHPDMLVLDVLNELLGGFFGSRLMKNIREEKGLTYGIYSNLVFLLQDSYLLIAADVSKEKTEEAVQEIYREIEKLAEEKIAEDELNLVKNYMAGSHLKSITTPFAIAEHFKSLHYLGLTLEYYDHYIEKLQSVTAEDLRTAAARYFAGAFTEVLVG
jgi:predicted Zn-dependent peptidase